jgi:hypothetical protein
MFSRDWVFWLIVIVVFVLPRLLRELPKILEQRRKRTPPPQPQPVSQPKLSTKVQSKLLAAADQIRRALQQLEQQAQPPVSAAPAAEPVQKVVPPPPPVPEAPPQPRPTAAPAKARPPRAPAWAQSLRNKHNLRQAIVAAEIIGPPKGM